jgi:integrase/recombinase XerD
LSVYWNACPRGTGGWPSEPAATWTFCSRKAATTSLALRPRVASISEKQAIRLVGEAADDGRDAAAAPQPGDRAAALRGWPEELCGLRWRDVQGRGDAGQVTVYGKGGKARAVVLQPSVWTELVELRGNAPDDAPVFYSRKGGHLSPFHVGWIVKAEAKRAGLKKNISPHFLRHSHATHTLENGAPIHLVSATLGHASIATTGRYLHARPSQSSGRYLKL